MNMKLSEFVYYVKPIILLLLYSLHDDTLYSLHGCKYGSHHFFTVKQKKTFKKHLLHLLNNFISWLSKYCHLNLEEKNFKKLLIRA